MMAGVLPFKAPLALMELNKYAKTKFGLQNKLLLGLAWDIVFGLVATIGTAFLLMGTLEYLLAMLPFIPGAKDASQFLGDMRLRLFRLVSFDSTRGIVNSQGFNAPGEKEPQPYTLWQIIGFAALGATIIAPHKVIPAALRLAGNVVGGVTSVIRGGKGRGRPAGGGKKAIGAGAPPDVNKAIDDIKKGQADGNPFLVKKGIEKLKRAKQMGLPVPKGYIDGLFGFLGWKG
jgi:hypothetical protein